MLQVEYRLKLGQDEFVLKAEVKNEKEFFQKMAFFSSLPKTAPNGATDLKLVVRETAKGTYYSIVSEQEKLEFKLGQHKEGDTLYAKGWEPLFQKESEQSQGAPAPAFGTQQQAAPAAAPAQQAAPPFGGFGVPQTQAQTAAPAAPAPAFGAGQMPVPQTVAAPAAAPASAPAAAAPTAPAQANPQVQAVANNVLARFGINK